MRERVGLDTGFFVRLLAGSPEPVEIYRKILEGESVGVVSVVVIFELRRLALRGVVEREAYQVLERNWPLLFHVEPVDQELALEAASVSHGTGLPAADALIYATYKRAGCIVIYTTDADFAKVSRKEPRIVFLE